MDYTKEIVALRTSLEEIEKKLSLVRKSASADYQTQIDQINSNVNACQNSLSSIEQDLLTINGVLLSYHGEIETNATNISNITAQIEGIETSLTTCVSSITTLNSQVATLQFDMNIAKGNITSLSTTLNLAVFDLELLKVTVETARTDILTLKSQMSTAQTNISNNASDIDTLQSDMSTAQSDIETNASSISSLQSSLSAVAFSGDYDDLTNKPSGGGGSLNEENEMASEVLTSPTDEIYETIEFEWWDDNSQKVCHNMYFTCSPEEYIEGNVDVYLFSYPTTNSPIVRLFYGEELICENTFSITLYEKLVNFPFKFYPNDKKGYFRITVEGFDVVIKYASFHITSSKNFLFLDNNLRWTVSVVNHKYYIVKNFKFPNGYYKLDANNFDLSNIQYMTGAPIWGTLFPKPIYSGGTLTIDENDHLLLGRNLWNFKHSIYSSAWQTIKSSKEITIGFSYTYFTDHSATYSYFTVTSVYGASRKLIYWSGHSNSVFETNFMPYKINNVEVESGCWISNNAVRQVNMSNAPFNVFQGSVAVRDDGMCIFFPHYNATYTIELGIGRRPTAFRQENGNINIYIGRSNYVIKFVLVKNLSTRQYI